MHDTPLKHLYLIILRQIPPRGGLRKPPPQGGFKETPLEGGFLSER